MTYNPDAIPAAAPQPAESTAVDASIPAAPAPAPAWEPDPNAPAPQPNLAVGVAAGVGLGLLAALVYAGVTIFSEREFLMLGLLIGAAIAFGFHRFGHTRGIVPAVLAAVIAFVLYFVAIFLAGAGTISKLYDETFLDGLRDVIQNASAFLEAYFSDGTSYLFLGISVLMAGYYAFGGRAAK